MIKVLPPKTAKEVVARERERKAKTTLLMALPEDHLEKFLKMADAKEMWEAIKSRFGGNDESKKMQKYFLKQQFEEIHGAGISHKDANQKFLRSIPSSWSQVALITRTKPGLDTLSFDDLYNNLRVFERYVKGTTASSSSNTQNVAFVSADNTSNTNDINYDDLEEMDLKWQVVMISIRIKKFHKKTGRKLHFDTRDTVGFDKTKVECFNCHKMRHFARDERAKRNQDSKRRDGGYNGNKARDNGRRPTYQVDSKALVTIDGEAIDWFGHVEEDTQIFAMMAYSSSNSVADYDDDYQGDTVQNKSNDPLTSAMMLLACAITRNFSNLTNNHLRTSSNTRNQSIAQGERVNIQSKNFGIVVNVQCYNCSEKGHYARNCPMPRIRDSKYFMEHMLLTKQDEAGVLFIDEQNDFLFADVSQMEEIKKLSANICLIARIQPAIIDGSSNYSAFLSEVQNPSTSYVNPLFATDNEEQKYPMQPKIINKSIGTDQIDSNIIFDEPNEDVNSGSDENDNNVQDSYELEQLGRNAYKDAEKQQITAKKFKNKT
nr:ribonuclease H-like domain-containing protein [Tanacetum cinerariifolium]